MQLCTFTDIERAVESKRKHEENVDDGMQSVDGEIQE
jgi:hypothetical protein